MTKQFRVAYICDGEKCGDKKCHDECQHTTNEDHALHRDVVLLFRNFVALAKEIDKYFETNVSKDCITFAEKISHDD